jgi:hypothetical protein
MTDTVGLFFRVLPLDQDRRCRIEPFPTLPGQNAARPQRYHGVLQLPPLRVKGKAKATANLKVRRPFILIAAQRHDPGWQPSASVGSIGTGGGSTARKAIGNVGKRG